MTTWFFIAAIDNAQRNSEEEAMEGLILSRNDVMMHMLQCKEMQEMKAAAEARKQNEGVPQGSSIAAHIKKVNIVMEILLELLSQSLSQLSYGKENKSLTKVLHQVKTYIQWISPPLRSNPLGLYPA